MLYRVTGLAWLAVLVFALYWTVRLGRADWLFVKGDAASFREALRLATGNAEYASALAEAEPARAEEILKDAAARNPLDGGLRVELGLAEEERGDFGGAEKDLLQAARLDRGFAPRWALGDFYFHRHDAEKFWPVVRDALGVSYGDVSAQFRQCWSLTGDADFVLERAIPDRPAVLRRYLDFLVTEGRLDAAGPVAQRVMARADREAAPSLENYCDRMLADWRGEDALAIWNGLVERKLIAESGHGFDWRISVAEGIHVERAGDGWVLRFNGRQPESAEILSRYVPLAPGRRYRISGCPTESGIECRLLVADGRDLLLPSFARLDKLKHVPQRAARKLLAVSFQLSAFERHEIVAACKGYGGIGMQIAMFPGVGHALAYRAGRQPGHSPQATEGDEAQPAMLLNRALSRPLADGRGSETLDGFRVPDNVDLGRLVLAYRRVPGTTRIEGSIAVEEFAVKAAER
jgi:hypothetical protein